MAKEDNLRPGEYKFTKEDNRKGGIKSGETRRRKRLLREALEALLEQEYHTSDGRTVAGDEAISIKLMQNALNGDNRAFEIIRDTIGQKPVDRVEVDSIDPDRRAEIEALLGLE